jgi:hypothetical protein
MEPTEWIALIGLLIVLLSAIYSVMKVVTKSIMIELLPNSGKSMRDEIIRLSARVDSIYEILSKKSS